MKAYLILEDKTIFSGMGIGSDKEIVSELVFNTSMTGYTEILTDPSYAGQAVVMTYPIIGSYGVSYEDMESVRPCAQALIVRELSDISSNFRSRTGLEEFMFKYDIPGISGIDTRHLTKKLRDYGTMNAMVTRKLPQGDDLDKVIERIRAYRVKGVVEAVTCKKSYTLPGNGMKVALLDCGAKDNIAKSLHKRGCHVTVWPAFTEAQTIIDSKPDGIMLSNGPGDPKENTQIIKQIKKLYDSDIPIFAICLGHQLMALALGGDTYKLKYGHRGGNHPVKDHETGRTYITSQNHGYAVDEKSLNKSVAQAAFTNVNDGTNEGLRYIGKNIFTVQYHPEACPGPHDSDYLFDKFIKMMEDNR